MYSSFFFLFLCYSSFIRVFLFIFRSKFQSCLLIFFFLPYLIIVACNNHNGTDARLFIAIKSNYYLCSTRSHLIPHIDLFLFFFLYIVNCLNRSTSSIRNFVIRGKYQYEFSTDKMNVIFCVNNSFIFT